MYGLELSTHVANGVAISYLLLVLMGSTKSMICQEVVYAEGTSQVSGLGSGRWYLPNSYTITTYQYVVLEANKISAEEDGSKAMEWKEDRGIRGNESDQPILHGIIER